MSRLRLWGAVGMIVAVAFAGTFAGATLVYSVSAQCRYAQRQWDALHKVIVAATPPVDTAKIPPQFRKYVNPRQSQELRARLEDAQGSRPSC